MIGCVDVNPGFMMLTATGVDLVSILELQENQRKLASNTDSAEPGKCLSPK